MTNRPASLHLNVSHWAWPVQKSRVIYYSTAISCHKYISNGVLKWGIHIQSLTDTIIIMIGIGRAPREVQFPTKSIRYKTHGRRNMGQRSIHRFRFQSIIIIAKAHSVLCCVWHANCWIASIEKYSRFFPFSTQSFVTELEDACPSSSSPTKDTARRQQQQQT